MLTAPTPQTISRQMTEPKVCVYGGFQCGAAAGLGSGIFTGVKVTSCTCTNFLKDCCCCLGNIDQADRCLKLGLMTGKVCATFGICSGMTVAGGLVGVLTMGSLGYACANKEQRSRYCASASGLPSACSTLAKFLCCYPGPFSDSRCSRPEQQEQSAPDKNSAVIDVEPLLHDTHLPAPAGSMAPPPYNTLNYPPNHAPPNYEEAINSLADGVQSNNPD